MANGTKYYFQSKAIFQKPQFLMDYILLEDTFLQSQFIYLTLLLMSITRQSSKY